VIRRRSRRVATVAALALAAAAATAVPAAVAAGSSSSPIVIDSVSSPPGEPGLLSIQAEASSKITTLTVTIASDTRPVLTIPFYHLSLTSGTATNGTWTVQTPIDTSELSLGTYQVSVDATDANGDSVTGLSPPGSFFFGLYPAVTITSSATTLSYSQQSVTFTGQVTADSPVGVPEGVSGQQVSITGPNGGSWSATTDPGGNYSVTATPDLTSNTGLAGSFSASVSGGPAIKTASSAGVEVTGVVDPVQVKVALSKSMVDFGTRVRLSGTASYESGTTRFLFAKSTVIDISGKDHYTGRSVQQIQTKTTDANGSFNVVLPAQPTTTWTADPPPNQYLDLTSAQVGVPNSATLTVVLPTRTTSLHVAYTPSGRVTASGCLGLGSAVASFRGLPLPADANIHLQYSRTSRGPWRTLGSLTHGNGPRCRGGTGFKGTAGAVPVSGHYRVNFSGQPLYQRSVSTSQHAATAPTRFASFNVTPRAVSGHGRIRVSGQLQQKASRWKGLGGARITIFVKPAGSANWYFFKKNVPVSRSGRFGISFADPVSGHWAVGYAGNASHLQTTSRSIHVSASGATAHLRDVLGARALLAGM
jgi:hypothetical protein